MTNAPQLPLWLKIAYSLPVCVLVPIYFDNYGPAHFLWFSNVALLTTVALLWLESRLLASMMTLAVLLPELGWNLDFFIGLAIGKSPFGFTAYMFDPDMPLVLRALSLYHVPLPFLLLWVTLRLGYDPAALRWQTLLGWLILLASCAFSSPENDINWTRSPQLGAWMPRHAILITLMLALPLLVYLPTHLLLKKLSAAASIRRFC
jgi:hypothetical protein